MFADLTAETLARMQFAFTVSFHIIFPALSIGLASFLAVMNALWLITGEQVYRTLFDHWRRIFAVAFGMGVVSGVVMSFQFGTNWAVFADKAGPVIGPLMAYEVLTAFFLEAGFLGVMLFGRDRVGNGLHMFATAMVAFGTLLSATWILSVNSWMQTPAGFTTNEAGQFVPTDWGEVIFNPSFHFRLSHMVIAAFLTTSLVVGGASAWVLLRDRADPAARRSFAMAMRAVIILAPLQLFVGDAQGRNTLEHQPVKIMAIEGHFESYPDGAPLVLFGIPDQENQRIDYAVSIPKLSSLILKHDLNAPLDGLDTVQVADQPPVGIIFFSFRLMVGLGVAILLLGLWGAWARWRGVLYGSPWLLRAAVAAGPAGFVAILAGWVTTEVGRQPYTVYGVLRTSDSVSPVAASAVASSLTGFIIVYGLVFVAGVTYILRLMAAAPDVGIPEHRGKPVNAASRHPLDGGF